jgi:RimJ/RimL family protein N-acetyltransferase
MEHVLRGESILLTCGDISWLCMPLLGWTETDVTAMNFALSSNKDYLQRNIGYPNVAFDTGMLGLDYARSMLRRLAGPCNYLLYVSDGSRLMGLCGLKGNIAHGQWKLELGYFIIPEFQHKGIISTTTFMVLNRAYKSHDSLAIVHGNCLEDNDSSRAVLERLGFSLSPVATESVRGVRREELVVYTMGRDRWQRQSQGGISAPTTPVPAGLDEHWYSADGRAGWE